MEWSKVRRFLLLAFALLVFAGEGKSQEQEIRLQVRHDHLLGSCNGTLVMDQRGVRYETNQDDDSRTWNFEDIKEAQLGKDKRLKLLTYEDRSNWKLGADRTFEFAWADESISGQRLYSFLIGHLKRPIAAALVPAEIGTVQYSFPVKHLGVLKGMQGQLLFSENNVAFQSSSGRGDRSWRYQDLESISSAGPYDIALTTYEQKRFHYASRAVYNFQLKAALPRDSYDQLWRFVNEKKR